MATSSPGFGQRALRFLSQLLKSMWLFFPGILFLLFTIFCFWLLGQGKDIIVAFTENQSRTILGLNYTRIVFFLAIGFWVYVSWYSSRIISYIKKSKQEDIIQEISGVDRAEAEKAYVKHKNFFEISIDFLDEIPRVLGNACFFILELAVLQSPVLVHPLSSTMASIILILGLLVIRFVNNWILEKHAQKPSFRRIFWILFVALVALIIVASLINRISILSLFGLLLLNHIVFIYYINLRHIQMERKAAKVKVATEKQSRSSRSLLERLMDYFCIPRKEGGYFQFYLIAGLIGLICYLAAIISLSFARNIGPFPFIILAFGVLLAFGNTVTAFSIRFKVNFHFLLFILAFMLGLGETHYVRTVKLTNSDNGYEKRPPLDAYLAAWLKDRQVDLDSSENGYNVYFVMANGGASRSGYWTAAVLGRIEDSTLHFNPADRFSNHVFCLSGTSGGGVGVAAFFSLLREKEKNLRPIYDSSARDYLNQDYFTYTFARMLGPDYFNYIFHLSSAKDRAAALESSFEESSQNYDKRFYQVPFYDLFSNFPAMKDGKVTLPILFINTTRMQDGNPGVVTNLNISRDTGIFNNRVDVVSLLKKDEDISITSAAIMGARFPYLSPAGRIADNYFVDGGYFDNSGAGVVQEMIRGIINIANDDSLHGGTAYKQIRKLHFKVLHIVNSPIDLDSTNIKSVPPIKNDLMAPILTIIGAYNMQTTVNDGRLTNFISDINKYYQKGRADYTQISLYEDSTEFKGSPLFINKRFTQDPPYAMNWFMSDTTLHRINGRLASNGGLNSIINGMRKPDSLSKQ